MIGSSGVNSFTYEFFGEWNYSMNDPIFKIIQDEDDIYAIFAGSDALLTKKAIDVIINESEYYDTFSTDCLVVNGCEIKPSSDMDGNEITTFKEIVVLTRLFFKTMVAKEDFVSSVKRWITD